MSEDGWVYLLCAVAIVNSLAAMGLTVLNVLAMRRLEASAPHER